jgi:hypothetical protein
LESLTLDTNVLNDWAWAEGISSDQRYGNNSVVRAKLNLLYRELGKMRDDNLCELGITNQIFTDYEKDAGELPEFISGMIGKYVTLTLPSISTFPMVFPFVFADEKAILGIMADVFPHSKQENKKYLSNKKDALQLYAHSVAKRDVFLTSDRKILSARKVLISKWNIQVMSLDEYINQHNKNVEFPYPWN